MQALGPEQKSVLAQQPSYAAFPGCETQPWTSDFRFPSPMRRHSNQRMHRCSELLGKCFCEHDPPGCNATSCIMPSHVKTLNKTLGRHDINNERLS